MFLSLKKNIEVYSYKVTAFLKMLTKKRELLCQFVQVYFKRDSVDLHKAGSVLFSHTFNPYSSSIRFGSL